MKSKEEIEVMANDFVAFAFNKQDLYDGFINGYTQCQEDISDKKYTEEDLLYAFTRGVCVPNSQIGIMEDIFKQVVHSLNKKD